MKSPNSSNRLIVSILVVAAAAIAFWMLALSPKRDEADKLATQAEQARVALSTAQSEVATAVAAKQEFPTNYRQLVVLGQAVPADDETSSLLVELNHVATASKVKFNSINLAGSGESAPTSATAPPTSSASPEPSEGATGAVPAAATTPPTEAAASLLPLGASVGPAGLAVMPYSLTFSGSFFHVADFIKGIDSLVHTGGSKVAADGRLVTLNSFTLSGGAESFPKLNATFSVTTYLTPPSQGLTAGATATEPATSVPATEEAPPAETASSETSETASAAQ
jgi:Tfp pilus assembly protein PilO